MLCTVRFHFFKFISFFKNKEFILDVFFEKIWKYIKRILHSNDTLNGPWHNVFLIYETYISIFDRRPYDDDKKLENNE